MSPEIKFSSWGIPYIVEFANVKFRRKLMHKRRSLCPPPVPPKDTRYLYTLPVSNDSDWTFASSSSETLNEQYPVVGKEESEGRVLYIRFASEGLTAIPGPALSSRRLHTLGRRIAGALVAVGMVPSPASERINSDGSITKRASMPAHAGSLYSGTYGQVITALNSAGLTSTLCDEDAVPGGEGRLQSDCMKVDCVFTSYPSWDDVCPSRHAQWRIRVD